MSLKKVTLDPDRPNVVALYDIGDGDPRAVAGMKTKSGESHQLDDFSGVVVDTDTQKVTHVLIRTKKIADSLDKQYGSADNIGSHHTETYLQETYPAYAEGGVKLYQQPFFRWSKKGQPSVNLGDSGSLASSKNYMPDTVRAVLRALEEDKGEFQKLRDKKDDGNLQKTEQTYYAAPPSSSVRVVINGVHCTPFIFQEGNHASCIFTMARLPPIKMQILSQTH